MTIKDERQEKGGGEDDARVKCAGCEGDNRLVQIAVALNRASVAAVVLSLLRVSPPLCRFFELNDCSSTRGGVSCIVMLS